ncbi:hypothetical protein J6590_081158 [Homalodisca vitripennis]|nr:hypothetical protein J6590_081158 [Homalodisca vitripennis]
MTTLPWWKHSGLSDANQTLPRITCGIMLCRAKMTIFLSLNCNDGASTEFKFFAGNKRGGGKKLQHQNRDNYYE